MPGRNKRLSQTPVTAVVERLSHEGRGIASVDGRKVFIDGALPGETVQFIYRRKNSRIAEGRLLEVIEPSDRRVNPACRYFEQCGGCSLQHMSGADQLAHKQGVLLEQLRHIGSVEPESVMPPLTGPELGYRHKARVGVKYVEKKHKLLIGFREKGSGRLADIDSCEVLHPAFGQRLQALQGLISGLEIFDRVPQLEIAAGDDHNALILRHLSPLGSGDRASLERFQDESGISILLQPGGPDSVTGLNGDSRSVLSYQLHDYGIRLEFGAAEFTQVNFRMNNLMVGLVMELLAPQREDTVLDLFCGLGNFTLPIAVSTAHVTGIEGLQSLVDRARNNAAINSIGNVEFRVMDLENELQMQAADNSKYSKVLMDPPRNGARGVVEGMDLAGTQRLVYVSCNPATLARDAGILVRDKGFRLKKAGIMDMFPQTSHVESIALFEH